MKNYLLRVYDAIYFNDWGIELKSSRKRVHVGLLRSGVARLRPGTDEILIRFRFPFNSFWNRIKGFIENEYLHKDMGQISIFRVR